MAGELESPDQGGLPRWDDLYRARGPEVSFSRPVFTGDIFNGVKLPGSTGTVKARSIIVLQHPCSMRTNGIDLAWRILVAEVAKHKEIGEDGWARGYYNLMPLPDLQPDLKTQARNQAADFDKLHTVPPKMLSSSNRLAVLSPTGVNLLLQRWVHYSSRVIVPTHLFQEQTVAFYEEADLVEEWCDESELDDYHAATKKCLEWLRADRDGTTYQKMLGNPQSHSTVRRAMRLELRRMREIKDVR